MLVQQISANDAFELLALWQNPPQDLSQQSILIDVRTDVEFNFVGTTDLSKINAPMILLPWKIYPSMALNPNFTTQLEKELSNKFGDQRFDTNLIFICLSGGRSQQAAMHMAQLGYKKCFNLIGGFEGEVDAFGHRGNINGWKASNLPWRQL